MGINTTELQKNVANNIINQAMTTGRVNKGKAIRDAGGGEFTAKTPKIILESQGFKKYMAEAGITEENLAKMLAEDLRLKPQERLGEMKLAAELLDLKENNLNINIKNSDDYLDSMKEAVINSMRNGDEEEAGEVSEDS